MTICEVRFDGEYRQTREDMYELTSWDYEEIVPILLRSNRSKWRDYRLVLPGWDNTPLSGMRGLVFQDATPEKFRGLLRDAFAALPITRRKSELSFSRLGMNGRKATTSSQTRSGVGRGWR